MKFIADEDLGREVPKYLQNLGFEIVAVVEVARGKPDVDILAIANKEGRILITLDKDFGELVYKEKFIHVGVIFIRLKDESIANKKRVLKYVLGQNKNYFKKFVAVREKVDGKITIKISPKTN